MSLTLIQCFSLTTDELNPEFRDRRPPPSYSVAMSMSRPAPALLSSAAPCRQNALATSSNIPVRTISTCSTPPPAYRSCTSTLRAPSSDIVYPFMGYAYPSSRPPTYRSYVSTRFQNRPSLDTTADMRISYRPAVSPEFDVAYDNIGIEMNDEELQGRRHVASFSGGPTRRNGTSLEMRNLQLSSLDDDTMTRAERVVQYLQNMLRNEHVAEDRDVGDSSSDGEERLDADVSADTGIGLSISIDTIGNDNSSVAEVLPENSLNFLATISASGVIEEISRLHPQSTSQNTQGMSQNPQVMSQNTQGMSQNPQGMS